MIEIQIPNLDMLADGELLCSSCGKTIAWDKVLQASPCPACGNMLYYPMTIRNYILYKPLGGGGVGHVFKSYRMVTRQKYAVKILQRSKKDDSHYIRNFLREAHAGITVGDHKNLIKIAEYGYDRGEFYVVMPFIEGERLDIYIQRKKYISEQRAVNIILQIIEAEIHISQRGFLYRDLKPENIILERNGNIRMFDYGLCIRKNDALAQEFTPDDFEGSPLYIPPERIVGASEGEYSEIYSLGMILFHMLKGRPYFSETEINDIITRHVSSFRILSVKGYLKNCSKELVSIIDKMIARKPDMRYPDFQPLKKDLEAISKELHDRPSVFLKGSKSVS